MSGAELLSPSPSSTTSKFIPSHADGTPIIFLSGNKAEIPGYLHEFDLCCIRKGKFANLAKFRGVLVKDKMAVDAADAVYFVANPKAAPP